MFPDSSRCDSLGVAAFMARSPSVLCLVQGTEGKCIADTEMATLLGCEHIYNVYGARTVQYIEDDDTHFGFNLIGAHATSEAILVLSVTLLTYIYELLQSS